MNIDLNQYLLLYNIHNNLLKPVDKLINLNELNTILEGYKFNDELYSLPYLFFCEEGDNVMHYNNVLVCEVTVEEYFDIDFDYVSLKIFGTTNKDHPGVYSFYQNKGKKCLAGKINYFNPGELNIPYITPKSFGNDFVFQSRNPPHKAHENIVKKYSNLLYTTPFSTTKASDYSFELKLKCYEVIKDVYGIDLFVSTLPRVFAGPREALQNCILFRNLGCKNFIMGRGKNCVGNFYGDTESYDFCKKFDININVVWEDTQYDSNNQELKASVIKKEYIDKGIKPPQESMSDYISNILLEGI